MLSDKYHASRADLRRAQMIVSFQQGMSRTRKHASRQMSILSRQLIYRWRLVQQELPYENVVFVVQS